MKLTRPKRTSKTGYAIPEPAGMAFFINNIPRQSLPCVRGGGTAKAVTEGL